MNDRKTKTWRSAIPLLSVALLAVASCGGEQQTADRNATNAVAARPAPLDPMVEARRCGSALGMATRCNLLGDASDFAILRKSVITRISGRSPDADANLLAEAVDMAALDRLTVVRGCQVPVDRVVEVEKRFQSTLSNCLR